MEIKKTTKSLLKLFVVFLLCSQGYAQVGIGIENPDPSSILDLSSNSAGLLMPRMTTAQRTQISSPANGLMVYDTTEGAFYFFKSGAWAKLDSSVRSNYKLIKSAADLSSELTAGGGSKYLLNSNTFYEINGSIMLAAPIDLNNAYISGMDSNDDQLIKSGGQMFVGSTGGTIKTLTLACPGGTIFSLSNGTAQNLIFRDAIVVNSTSVGSISGFDLVFFSIIQFVNNTTGITFNNIDKLLLSNTGWFKTNRGTFETYTGTFSFLQKQGGFMIIDGAAKGIDVSSNPVVGEAILTGVSFSGTSTEYIKRYTTGSYAGYNFNSSWTVDSPGIKLESDQVASANIYYNGAITTGFVQTFSSGTELNLTGNSNTNTTTAVNMLRTSSAQNNRITYLGKKTRTFQINAALSVRGQSGVGDFYAFFIRKNGTTTLVETNTLMRVNSTVDISSNSITGTVQLAPNDFIEIWGQRLTTTGSGSIAVFSLNLNIK